MKLVINVQNNTNGPINGIEYEIDETWTQEKCELRAEEYLQALRDMDVIGDNGCLDWYVEDEDGNDITGWLSRENPDREVKMHKTLKERFASYTGDYKTEEWDTGKPVGEEIW